MFPVLSMTARWVVSLSDWLSPSRGAGAELRATPAVTPLEYFHGSPCCGISGQGTAAGRSIGARVRATDTDAGDILIYSLTGQDAGLFDIDPATGQLRTKAVLDYDPDPQAENTYTVTVNVHDGFDNAYGPSTNTDATIDVPITVTRVTRRPPPLPTNRSPSFSEGDETSRSVAENAAAGQDIGGPLEAVDPDRGDTLTYTLEGEDAGSFDIDAATGQLRTKAALDYETRTSYTVIARVEDPRGRSDAITVTVAVTNVGLSGIAGQYDRDDNETIDRDEVLAAVADYFRGAIDREETLAIIRLYFAGLEGGGAPSNRSPSFSEGDETSRSVAENTAAGQGIGAPLEAVDPDRGDTLTYTLEGEDAGSISYFCQCSKPPWGQVAQRTVGSFPIVISSPRLHLLFSILQGQKPVLIQTLLTKPPIE